MSTVIHSSAGADASAAREPLDVPLREMISLARHGGMLHMLETLGNHANGQIIRLHLPGRFRPYMLSHPDHLAHVLRTHKDNYPRGAAMWHALGRLTGEGIGGEGAQWQASRKILQPAFSGAYLSSMGEQMISAILAAVEDLAHRAGPDRPVDAGVEMTRIVQRVINPTFFGNLVPDGEGDRLGEAVATAMGSLLWRMGLPFVPHWVPLPGDREFRRAKRTVYDILRPVVSAARNGPLDGRDVVTSLINGTGADGTPMTDEQVIQDVVALFVAGSESSAIALTWVWVALAQHPDTAARVLEEVEEVIGDGPPRREHVRKLSYTRAVLDEVLRMRSVGWAVPRVAVRDDVIDGVPIPAGSTLAISPYLTHRLPDFWDQPTVFDPGRFSREHSRHRHPLAYVPFGDGAHQCLGQAFFAQEAALVVAIMLRRFHVRLADHLTDQVQAKLSLTVQPRGRRRRDPVELVLTPRR